MITCAIRFSLLAARFSPFAGRLSLLDFRCSRLVRDVPSKLNNSIHGIRLAEYRNMTLANRVARWGGARLSSRVGRSIPWIGAAIAVATVFSTIRRKGVISGTLDTGLNAIPVVGAAKNMVEVIRGRDFFPDRFQHPR
jgi:hypothetical protein